MAAESTETDLVDFLAFDLGRALGRASGAHYVSGSGTNQPRGVVTATVAEVGTAVAGTVASGVDANELIDMVYGGVNEEYAANGVWVMAPATFGYIRNLRDGNNAFLVSNLADGGPPRLLGKPVFLDPSVAALGSGNASI
ncbi:MAG TPA: phage major capsid protein, partial [Acidimicrobiia bacterium]